MVSPVSRNATLDEFGKWSNDEDGIEPIEPVVTWEPEDGDCPRCGKPIREQWNDGTVVGVCTACKEW